MKKRVLITGIQGHIGRVLSAGLRRTYQLYGIDRQGPFNRQVIEADVADYPQVAGAFQKFSPLDCVIHLAADANVEASWESVLSSNIVGTRSVYEAAREFKVRKVIFASSNHVTGAYEGLDADLHLHTQFEPPKITVRDPIRPDSDYGVSKAFGEALARYYCARWGIETICLRIGSVWADDDPSKYQRLRKTWLSHRDLVQLVKKSIESNVVFGIYYGISNNKGAFWDISNARDELGYAPQDDASTR